MNYSNHLYTVGDLSVLEINVTYHISPNNFNITTIKVHSIKTKSSLYFDNFITAQSRRNQGPLELKFLGETCACSMHN